ncbi:hypothetical protein G6F56_011955 [Rhizopus delemar]|nr:hypothetical protein G6F56_011955 [Rhizopus delemar]
MLDITNLLNNPEKTPFNLPSPTSSLESSPATSPASSLSSSPASSSYPFPHQDEDWEEDIKTKRKRANSKQLQVLNKVFDRTFFPSTQVRAELGRQLNMSPRTVQIWFQNRRQAMRTKERQRLIKLQKDSKSI